MIIPESGADATRIAEIQAINDKTVYDFIQDAVSFQLMLLVNFLKIYKKESKIVLGYNPGLCLLISFFAIRNMLQSEK